MENFTNKIVVVTGGTSGIGYATAKEFSDRGAKVIITGRRKEVLDTAARELGVDAYLADQSKVADTGQLVATIKEKYGQVDVLFINAGVAGVSTIADATEEGYDRIMDINVRGAFFTLSRFIPILSDGASVVFLSSNTASMIRAGSAVYASGKMALNGIMKTAAVELAPRRIRVNAVSPGPTDTGILSKMGLDAASIPAITEHLVNVIPLKTMGHAADVASMVVYLSSDAAKFTTGAELVMDGGMSLG
ncbi:MAG: SDR family oxidoreductase [Chitinophagaceae bacterium]|nr:MAG: SDR family oxidoreductase [Chitinophagaceae bacterium]